MHELASACYDLVALRLGRPAGFDGHWRWNSAVDQHAVEVYLMLDEELGALTFHVESPRCPLKFVTVRGMRELRLVLDYVLGLPL